MRGQEEEDRTNDEEEAGFFLGRRKNHFLGIKVLPSLLNSMFYF